MTHNIRSFHHLVLLGAVSSLMSLGCDPSTGPTRMNPADQLWEVHFARRAITMSTVAPYDTLTLGMIAVNGLGDTLREGVQVTYHSVTDTTVRILDDGVLTVRTPTDPEGIKIVAQVTYKDVTRTDTALVVVTPTPPHILDTLVLKAIDAQTQMPREAAWSIYAGAEGNPILTSIAYDHNETGITVPVDYRSSDPTVAVVHPQTGEVLPQLEGSATIIATTTWYGKTYQTTLEISVIGVMYGTIIIQERSSRRSDAPVLVLTPGTIVVAAGAHIGWTNESSMHVDILFDDPTNVQPITAQTAELFALVCRITGMGCDVGKIGGHLSLPSFDPVGNPTGNSDVRSFPIPGVYRYRTSTGVTGTITVQ